MCRQVRARRPSPASRKVLSRNRSPRAPPLVATIGIGIGKDSPATVERVGDPGWQAWDLEAPEIMVAHGGAKACYNSYQNYGGTW